MDPVPYALAGSGIALAAPPRTFEAAKETAANWSTTTSTWKARWHPVLWLRLDMEGAVISVHTDLQ